MKTLDHGKMLLIFLHLLLFFILYNGKMSLPLCKFKLLRNLNLVVSMSLLLCFAFVVFIIVTKRKTTM